MENLVQQCERVVRHDLAKALTKCCRQTTLGGRTSPSSDLYVHLDDPIILLSLSFRGCITSQLHASCLTDGSTYTVTCAAKPTQ